MEFDVGATGESRGACWATVDLCGCHGVDEGVRGEGVAGLEGEEAGGGGCEVGGHFLCCEQRVLLRLFSDGKFLLGLE